MKGLLKPSNLITNNQPEFYQGLGSSDFHLERIKKSFLSDELYLERAQPKDAEAIVRFRNSRFDSPNRYTPYWMYHLTNFGNSVLLKNSDNKIKACLLEVSYANNEKTSYHVLVAVAKELSGKKIASRLIQYVSLKALQANSKVAQGTIAPDNFNSITSFINYSGAVLTSFVEDFNGFGPRFIFQIPLTIEAIIHQEIQKEKLLDLYQKRQDLNTNTLFIEASQIKEVQKVYKETNNRIIALLKKPITQEPVFLLTPFSKKDIS